MSVHVAAGSRLLKAAAMLVSGVVARSIPLTGVR